MGTSWLTNPLTNHLLGPLVMLLLVLFGGAALALFGFHLFYRKINNIVSISTPSGALRVSVSEQVLWQRYMTWAAIAVLFGGAVVSGPLAVAVLGAFLCWQGGQEYARLTGLPTVYRSVLILSGWVTLAAVLLWESEALVVAPALAFFGWSALALRAVDEEAEIGSRFTTGVAGFWGYLYLGWLPAFLLALSMSKAPGLVLVVGLGVALSDVGAFCMGKLLGGPKLAPRLSPNKTWGGVLGNFLGAALALALITFVLPGFLWWQYLLFVLAIGLGSIWGDLLESLLKRQCGVKDAGTLLPGFGGLLDRIDSLLFVAPLVYGIALFLIH